jgi:ATP-binding cassette subfamily F protein uup
MPPPILALQDVTHAYGGKRLFTNAQLLVYPKERLALVGRNGSGKSTLLKIAAGLVEPEFGERFVQPGTICTYLPQEPNFGNAPTAADYLAAIWQQRHTHNEPPGYRIEQALAQVELAGDKATAALSGGQARRLELARILLEEPDVLLLDEPTNHLDLPSIQWLENFIRRFNGAVLLISHDRTFLRNLTDASLWLERGQIRRYDQGFAQFEQWQADLLEQESRSHNKLDKLIAEETEWATGGIAGRRKRNQGRVKRLQEMRAVKAQQIRQSQKLNMEIGFGEESGFMVCEAIKLKKSYGGQMIVNDFTTRIKRGDRIGIIGPNGAGKSTLIKMLLGEIAPDGGKIRLGANLHIVSFDQNKSELKPEQTVREALTGNAGDFIDVRGRPMHHMGYLRQFLFPREYADAKVSTLSGGERTRLLLAKAMAKFANVLILDEPTNDLDMDTLDLLQDSLAEFEGTLLLVSHDRDFLDRVVTSTLVFEGDGKITEYAGGYSDYRRQLAANQDEQARRTEGQKPKSTSKTGQSGDVSVDEAQPTRPQRLSYQQQRALKLLPDKIEKLQTEIHDLENQLADPALFGRDPHGFEKITRSIAHATAELRLAEDQWLELAAMQDDIERAKA